LIAAAGVWEFYKECRRGALVRKALASYRLPDISRDVYAEPFMRVTPPPQLNAWKFLALFITVITVVLIMSFYVVRVILTGDFGEIRGRWEPHLGFILLLYTLTGGTIKLGPFLLIKAMIKGLQMRGPLLFFDRYMEIRPYLWKKRIYPYKALEVRVGKSNDVMGIRKYITIIPPSPEKTTWMDHIEIVDDARFLHYTTKEDFTRLGQFLEERVPNFHREETAGVLSDEDRKKRNLRWVYVILLLSALSYVFMAWYVLSHR
jgi:hypothetical protein